MKFTDIFICRPVLACVVSLLILLFGFHSMNALQISEYPAMKNTAITITTTYPGASADLIAGFITTPIESSVASSEGIDYMTSTSVQGVSTITIYVKLNFDPNTAFTDVMSNVQAVYNQLPKEAQSPIITKSTGNQIALMYISFSSDKMSQTQITDYITRVVQPEIQTIYGVSQVNILGGKVFSMRVWLNPQKMAEFGVTPKEVYAALQANNFQSAAGTTKGVYDGFNIYARTDLHSPEEFGKMVVKQEDKAIVRLRDIARVDLGAQSYNSSVTFNGKPGVFISIQATPIANPLKVIDDVRKALPEIEKVFPPTLRADVVYDSTTYIRASIHDVIKTIFEATIIVLIVIFLFLGSIRSVFIPVVTIPLSLVGVCTLMLFLGYSLNILTLLAMVLAIGLVVDDAIVVVENIHRHIEEGLSPFEAAIVGAREIASPVISMTITLAAVYAPIGFMGGLTGALFKEFAFTLASSVILSGVIALTLSPMMCAKLLSAEELHKPFVQHVDRMFERVRSRYASLLHSGLEYRQSTYLFVVVVLLSCGYLFMHTAKELAPTEDQSAIFVMGTAPQYANIDYTQTFSKQFSNIFASIPATADYFVVNGLNSANSVMAGDILKPWGERKLSQDDVLPIIQEKISHIAGFQSAAFPLPSLPGSAGGLPIQFVVKSAGDFKTLYQYSQELLVRAQSSGLFMYMDNTLIYNQPQLELTIDRNKAADLGINMSDVAAVLATSLGGNYTNWFSMNLRNYQVIPQLLRSFRLQPEQLRQIYIHTESGDLVPLSTFMTITQTVQPNQLAHFQQLNSATIEGIPMPGVTMGTALDYLEKQANEILPKDMSYDFSSQSRQYIQEGNALLYTFMFAVIIIFLVLAAQFESFRDPLIILISVPLSICGALIPLNLGAATINIYTQIGMITLVGLISKHGILMVQFANNLRETDGLSIREAIEKAAGIRLRAILMTTFAMVFGVVPLIISTGAGAESRFCIGLVIACGMSVGTLFTLFVVPTMYILLASKARKRIPVTR